MIALRAAWRRSQWFVLGALAAVGLALGFVGIANAVEPTSAGDYADVTYRTLQLTYLGGAGDDPVEWWSVGVARFMLPLVVAYSALAALLVVFRDRLRELKLPRLRGHTIIAGLGDKGTAFAHALSQTPESVVAIDEDPYCSGAVVARSLGMLVIAGDARDPVVLRTVGAQRAETVLAVAGDDSVNAEVALSVQSIVSAAPSRGPRCVVHIDEPDLARLLRIDALGRGADGAEVDFFSVDEHAALALRQRFLEAEGTSCRHLALVGSSSLLGRLLASVIEDPPAGAAVPKLTVADFLDDGQSLVDRLGPDAGRSPKVAHLLLEGTGAAAGEKLCKEDGVVIVDLEVDGSTLELALSLREPARAAGARVVACLRNSAGLKRVVAEARADSLDVLYAYSVIDDACTPALLFELSLMERLARAIHADYVKNHTTSQGPSDPNLPAMVRWEQLSEPLREANRQQAKDIGTKVHSCGYRIVPLAGSDDDPVTFTPEEIEKLARAEHERWCSERTKAGYVLGPRDDELKARPPDGKLHRLHPDLVPWEELDEHAKQKDRDAVLAIPTQLRLVGARIVRA